ncbi:hypothetical protein G7Z17_g696 [Cylindrodendrum hubeiense]|uniref:Uncharacterized protein n=1 Tax=Cylindrodendrum hubeiense TaxID=595255 RepID=A0A9P5HMA4_9HYPO|nr:hypothetical protein G7Z17_g696 [Cylindrodendrum hubeiense]
MDGQHGFQRQSSEVKHEVFSSGGFQLTSEGISHGGLQHTSEGFSRGGFKPTDEGFSQSGFTRGSRGFQSEGNDEVSVKAEDLIALREIIERGRESLDAAEEMLRKLVFMTTVCKE